MNKVAVIGPGALGCLFAARLAHAGVQVSLVDYLEKRAALLNKTGITVSSSDGDLHQHVPTVTTITDAPDLILVLVKAYTTSTLHLPSRVPVLTLQNGLGNAEILTAASTENPVLAGATSEAVTWLDVGRVRHVADGSTVFGSWTVCDTEAPLRLLQAAGFDARVTDVPQKAIWKKAIINAGINPLTAVLNVPNGALLDKQESRELMRDLVVEATNVAAAEGYSFEQNLVEETERMCHITRENISSMLQDIRNKKRTEIDAISGEVLRRGQNAQVPTPRTLDIYQQICALEQT